jgi:hypothetical protein
MTTTTKYTNALVWVRRTLTSGLTAVAFVNSYEHTVKWFTDNGQPEHAGWLGLIPEVGVFLVILTLATAALSREVKGIMYTIGAMSLGVTFTANLAGATGLAGICAALVAPVFAVMGFALEIVSLTQKKPAPTRKLSAPRKVPTDHKTPRLTKFDEGVLWATQREKNGQGWPTTAEIRAQFPATSETTAKKIRSSRTKVDS